MSKHKTGIHRVGTAFMVTRRCRRWIFRLRTRRQSEHSQNIDIHYLRGEKRLLANLLAYTCLQSFFLSFLYLL